MQQSHLEYTAGMQWIDRYQLFLFDFDGLLVDTERLHYEAYMMALSARKCHLNWDFLHYCQIAHLDEDGLRRAITAEFQQLVPIWDCFYQEKKSCYFSLLQEGKLRLMPGVQEVLVALEQMKIKRCVVTHSTKPQVLCIRAQLPLLNTIPHWITREDYVMPKPHSECYEQAISLHGVPEDRIIGFEDSIRGYRALKQTRATPVLICSAAHPLLKEEKPVLHYESFLEIV